MWRGKSNHAEPCGLLVNIKASGNPLKAEEGDQMCLFIRSLQPPPETEDGGRESLEAG